MYNHIRKTEFIDYVAAITKIEDLENVKRDYINFFDRIEEIETLKQKDLCEFTYADFQETLPMVIIKSTAYQHSTLSEMRTYIDWCIKNNYTKDKENRLKGITVNDIDTSYSYKMYMVKDEQQLVDKLDIILCDINEDTKDNMYRLLLHLVYNGVMYKDVFTLKSKDVNFQNNILIYGVDQVKLSDICMDLIKYNQDWYYIRTVGKPQQRPICKRGYLLETSSDDRIKINSSATVYISQKFKDLRNELEMSMNMTPTTIYKSGLFHRYYTNTLNAHENKLFNLKLLSEYNTWKKAFDL